MDVMNLTNIGFLTASLYHGTGPRQQNFTFQSLNKTNSGNLKPISALTGMMLCNQAGSLNYREVYSSIDSFGNLSHAIKVDYDNTLEFACISTAVFDTSFLVSFCLFSITNIQLFIFAY
eukprot:GHVR01082372.1.p1 GENE.GHVR01082372.1~~GHVR01082372.1.p1  ORF type:complete len:119 (-),score=2.61 GHVR01082372.1:387-743(-)